MAEDQDQRTEAATPKRRSEAHEKGQVALSRDLVTVVLLTCGTTIVLGILPWSLRPVLGLMRGLVEEAGRLDLDSSAALGMLLTRTAESLGLALAAPAGLLIVAAIAANIGQTGFVWATERLKPNFGVLNPMTGLTRIVSPKGLIEFGRGLIKLAVVSGLAFVVLRPIFLHMEVLIGLEPQAVLSVLASTFQHLMASILAVIGVIAALDFFYQRWQIEQSLRMSKQEVKEEHKNQDGDPHIKAHLRKIRMSRARRRMMAAVPKASVVITNPTHFAVALRYDPASMGAPQVVAKGADLVAQKIREIAKAHDVPLIENPPLARTLYATVEIDDEIPPDHYKAVAEIIGFVMRLRKGGVAAAAAGR